MPTPAASVTHADNPGRSCSECGARLDPRGRRPKNGRSLCGPCRQAGHEYPNASKQRIADRKAELFARWLEEDTVIDPKAYLLVRDLYGMYVTFVAPIDVDALYGRSTVMTLLEGRGLGHRDRDRGARYFVGIRSRRG